MPSRVYPVEYPYYPALLPAVQHFIFGVLHQCDQIGGYVLEMGSGHSTLWFAEELHSAVDSIEHDLDWYNEVQREILAEFSHHPVACHLMKPEEFVDYIIKEHRDESLDLVLIDGYAPQRINCMIAAIPKVKPGGWLVVDDTDRWLLRDAARHHTAEGWGNPQRFSGLFRRINGEDHMHYTEAYQKCS